MISSTRLLRKRLKWPRQERSKSLRHLSPPRSSTKMSRKSVRRTNSASKCFARREKSTPSVEKRVMLKRKKLRRNRNVFWLR